MIVTVQLNYADNEVMDCCSEVQSTIQLVGFGTEVADHQTKNEVCTIALNKPDNDVCH